jgi:hypothetical protein
MNLIRIQPDPALHAARHAQYQQQGFEIFWNGIKTGDGE